MEKHLSVRKLDFDKAQSLGGNKKVVTLFKESVSKVHTQYANDFDKISSKVCKIFANLFCSPAWDKLSQDAKSEMKHICDLHLKQDKFQSQDWQALLKTK